MKRVVFITKQGGQVSGMDACISALNTWMQFAANGTYAVSLERKREQRSIPQNKLMWMWFKAIADVWSDATGRKYLSEDVHDAYCIMFLPREAPNGMRYAGSTSALTKEEMTDFLNKVHADAATEYGITLPNPDDQLFEAWAAQYNNQ